MEDNNLDNLRHSCAHLLAAAVMELWPKTLRTIGPSIENGFYYDFDFEEVKISEEDFPKIEDKMHEILNSWEGFVGREVLKEEALNAYSDNDYKKELIEEFADDGQKLTFYKSGNYEDLCRGGHVENPKEALKNFKLLSVAGAYWRGSEKNKMLTRIYGTVFPSQEELDEYLKNQDEAKKRDHRKLGRELNLYLLTDEVGPGLLLLKPKGSIIRREIENLIITEQTKRGYQHVYTPHIGRKKLWETSGHWDLYRDKMYAPMKIDDEQYLVKPMNCPFHMMIYKSQPRSYRELPLRIAEIATVYRYEKPGELSGMLRVRHITQDDAHIFCRESQVVDEFIGVFDYMSFLLKVFGLNNFYLRLGLRSPKEKYLGNDEVWKRAEDEIVKAIEKKGLKYTKSEGDAAFYGPKLDVIIKDAIGREWQCGTIQVDFMLADRFGLEYINEEGKTERPVLIHRAPLGSTERFMGILIEHFAGNFPTWLNPVQVKILPISEKHLEYARSVMEKLKNENIRVEIDERSETLGAKIRDAQMEKVSYMAIVGDKEIENQSISVRARAGKDLGSQKIEDFTSNIKVEIGEKKLPQE
ncbi:MAG: Threonine-tRNA ligase [Microgenomates group bacterium GW2011_GWC1_37_12b]|uniref:Threonine--tRNA ligase n=1 Tax=Candidatus Woesebacteria bacterium GW2011_GWB1_38_8b TaxID=1618571 RepID=A0A0G0L699_9BACT|nr:MAG: Threonine-tRNA ligase [Microgenomates group bacterium GW2011_GWC1_37_12b]KKQ86552.1 MAG: Threonine-tRNA ligase [Candidatus Woesebacteria bacterium GW2011_GWB1_38_8b]